MMQQLNLQKPNIRFRFLYHAFQILPVVQILEKNLENSQRYKGNSQITAYRQSV